MTEWFYRNVTRRILFMLPPEVAHEVIIGMLRLGSHVPPLIRLLAGGGGEARPVEVFGVRFPNVVGLAAGMDKDAVALPAWEALGFGHAEVGTITAEAQPGNEKPRAFRLPPQEGLINRMGFNNEGADRVADRLARLRQRGRWPSIPVGINIGKSKVTPLEQAAGDYLHSLERLHAFGDYFVLNVSSPNTPGLRKLQDRHALGSLLAAVQAKSSELGEEKPVLLKIAPDLEFDQIEDVLGLVQEHRLAGIIATNTTIDHSSVPTDLDQEGGLSGRPLRQRATEIVRFISSKSTIPVIASGGVSDADAALEKLDAGASLVQIYTGFVYRGPKFVGEIVRAAAKRRPA